MKLLFVAALGLLLSSCSPNSGPRTGLEGKSMPILDFKMLDSTDALLGKVGGIKTPVVILYFSTSCPFCRAQVKELVTKSRELQGIQFYFVATDSYSQLNQFCRQFSLWNYKNIVVGRDYNFSIMQYFNISQVPYLAVYDSSHRLKQVNLGKMSSEDIKRIAFL